MYLGGQRVLSAFWNQLCCTIVQSAMAGLPAATEHLLTCLEKAEADLKAVGRRFEEEFQERCAVGMVRTPCDVDSTCVPPAHCRRTESAEQLPHVPGCAVYGE